MFGPLINPTHCVQIHYSLLGLVTCQRCVFVVVCLTWLSYKSALFLCSLAQMHAVCACLHASINSHHYSKHLNRTRLISSIKGQWTRWKLQRSNMWLSFYRTDSETVIYISGSHCFLPVNITVVSCCNSWLLNIYLVFACQINQIACYATVYNHTRQKNVWSKILQINNWLNSNSGFISA